MITKNLEDLRLEYGAHNIKVKTRATGYIDSQYSNSVTYTSKPRITYDSGTITVHNLSKTTTSVKLYCDSSLVETKTYAGAVDTTGTLTFDTSDYALEEGEHTFYAVAVWGDSSSETSSPTFTVNTSSGGVYGVSWTNDTTTTMTRTDDATGLTYTINSSEGTIASDFDDVFPWNKATVETLGKNKMLHMPAMYFRVGVDDNSDINSTAVAESAGSTGNWYAVPEFWYACYGMSISDSVAQSVSGVARGASFTRAQGRTYASNAGTGYQQLDLYHKNVMMFLWWIEFATKNSQSIMTGRIAGSGTSGGTSVCACGGTDSITTPSGFVPATAQMRWHYIEDFVGNMWEWIDGATFSTNLYVTADSTKFSDSVTNMTLSNLTRSKTSGSCKAIGWDSAQPFLCWCTKTNTSDTSSYNTGFCDAWYNTDSSNPCVHSGACWYVSSAYGGLSYFGRDYASDAYSGIGGRLLKTAS